MTDLPPLHPTRIAQSLENLREARTAITDETLETCRVALRQMQRVQNAIGFTTEVADQGARLIQTIGSLTEFVHKRR